ncbi:MAG: ribosomal protein S18-alanine N-acetyltransferase [Myxococcota bacterium]
MSFGEVRRLVGAEGASIVALVQRTLPDTWSDLAILAEAHREDARVWGLYTGGALVGFALVRVVLEEAELLLFGVEAARRREGLGRGLFEAVVDALAAEECSVIHLEVRAANLAAQRFYQALGFEEVGRRRAYYHSPSDDAVLMRRALGGPTSQRGW